MKRNSSGIVADGSEIGVPFPSGCFFSSVLSSPDLRQLEDAFDFMRFEKDRLTSRTVVGSSPVAKQLEGERGEPAALRVCLLSVAC